MKARLGQLWRRVRGRPRALLAVGGLLLVMGGAGGLVAMSRTSTPPPAIAEVVERVADLKPGAPDAPAALQAELDRLVSAYGEEVGVAVHDVEAGWTAGVDADGYFPQQSVSKLWVAMAVMKAVDEGRLDPDAWVRLEISDRSVFYQPISGNIGPAGFVTPLSALLRRALVESDNAANDRLIREAGGPEAVGEALTQLELEGVTVGAYERDLQSHIGGLTWRPEYGYGWSFQHAREQLPEPLRRQALESYLADPMDGAQPAAIVRALARLHRGELLSDGSTNQILGLMHEARTGPRRLKGGLPPGWTIAHKTGTGQDFQGSSIGINDVGLLTAPDGRVYAVAVMIRRTWKPVPARLALMQGVSRAVAAAWEADQGRPLPADMTVAAATPTSLPAAAD